MRIENLLQTSSGEERPRIRVSIGDPTEECVFGYKDLLSMSVEQLKECNIEIMGRKVYMNQPTIEERLLGVGFDCSDLLKDYELSDPALPLLRDLYDRCQSVTLLDP